jgi:hypothetical protein|tara:strand:+ start:1116 stop:1271 length:156 start_codon:yes stop_codon:yes gene_type:complete
MLTLFHRKLPFNQMPQIGTIVFCFCFMAGMGSEDHRFDAYTLLRSTTPRLI